jgi:hypothetical protein
MKSPARAGAVEGREAGADGPRKNRGGLFSEGRSQYQRFAIRADWKEGL